MTSDDFSLPFIHHPIVPFFSLPKNCFFISSLFLLLFSLHAFHFISFFPPQIPSVLCSTPPLTSLSFSAPVAYYRMFSSLPQTFHRTLLFLSKISSWYPSFIPAFPFLLSFTHFFPPHCTLTLPPRILISQSFMATLLLKSPPLDVSP